MPERIDAAALLRAARVAVVELELDAAVDGVPDEREGRIRLLLRGDRDLTRFGRGPAIAGDRQFGW